MSVWKCQKCRLEVEIDTAKKTKKITTPLKKGVGSFTFPTHPDCELGRALSVMDFSKLIKVRE